MLKCQRDKTDTGYPVDFSIVGYESTEILQERHVVGSTAGI